MGSKSTLALSAATHHLIPPQHPQKKRPVSPPILNYPAFSNGGLNNWRPRGISIHTRSFSFRGDGALSDNNVTGSPASVPVRVAYDLLLAGHRYLDVRTPDEFSAGHAAGAINIPYMYRVGSGMTRNPKFVEEVCAHFGKFDEIIVGCQSGKRSMMAATDLLAAGFTGVTDIAGGFAAWKQSQLPIED